MRSRPFVPVIALAALAFVGLAARADEPSDPNLAVARALFERGLYLMKSGDCGDAMNLYAEAEWRAPKSPYADLAREMASHCRVTTHVAPVAPPAGAPPAATPESMPAAPPAPRATTATGAVARAKADRSASRPAKPDALQPIDPYASLGPAVAPAPAAKAKAAPADPYAERVSDNPSAAPAKVPAKALPDAPLDPYAPGTKPAAGPKSAAPPNPAAPARPAPARPAPSRGSPAPAGPGVPVDPYGGR